MDIVQQLAKHPCALVVRSIGVEPEAVALIIAHFTKTQLQSATVVVSDPTSAYTDSDVKSGLKAEISILNYTQFVQASTTKVIEKQLLVFDSATTVYQLIGDDGLKTLLANGNYIIILWSLFDRDIIVKLRDSLPGSLLLKASFADLGMDIQFQLHESKMTRLQDLSYKLSADKEIKDPFSLTSMQYENIVYPTEVEKLLSTEKEDKSTDSSVLVEKYQEKLLDNGPKLYDLLMLITLNPNRRHLVYTRYNNHYGVSLIAALLKFYGMKVYTLKMGQKHADWKKTIEDFNQSSDDSTSVLVTSVMLPAIPKQIDHLHMMDGGFHNSQFLVNVIYKYFNYPKSKMPPTLTIHYYVSTRPDGKPSIGYTMYKKEIARWNQELSFYETALKMANPLIVGDRGRLLVGS